MKRLIPLLWIAACTPPQPVANDPEVTLTKPVAVASSSTSAAVLPAAKPIPGDLPREVKTKLNARASCSLSDCPDDTLQLGEAPSDSDAPGWIGSLAMEAGARLSVPENMAVTLYGVVLSGSVTLNTRNPTDGIASWPVPTWHAFRAPGAHVTLVAADAANLVLALATSGEPIIKALQVQPTVGPTPRPAKIQVTDIAKRTDLAWAGGAMHARIAFDEGRASLQILLGSASVGVPPHVHDGSWELLGLLEGAGEFTVATTSTTEGGGSVLAIPAGAEHAWQPSGQSRLVAVQLYVPPGPEQRFKTRSRRDAQPVPGPAPTPARPASRRFDGAW